VTRALPASGGRTLASLAVVVCVLAAAGAVAPPAAAADDVLVVDADGGGDYRSIDAAVAAASDGDTVRVRPGTYRERVTVAKNVTLVAPRGATLDGRSVSGDVSAISLRNDTHRGAAISVPDGSDAAPVIDGFRVRGYLVGVDASETTGDWTVRNTTVRNVTIGVWAYAATGDWTVRNSTVRRVTHFEAVNAIGATGDWTLADVTLRNVTRGVDASSTGGTWTIRGSTVAGAALVAVDASGAEAAWHLRDVTVRDATVGLKLDGAAGDWTVRNTTFRNLTRSERYDFRMPPIPEGTAVYARGTTGAWTVADSRFTGLDGPAVVATGAVPGGTTTGNTFDGRETAPSDACRGNVTCATSAGSTPTDTGGPATTSPPDDSTTQPSDDDTPDGVTSPRQPGVRVPLSPVPAIVALLAVAVVLAGRARR
jgi:hypothetical protein